MTTTNESSTRADPLPRYRVVVNADDLEIFEVMDTRTASGAWRAIETHTRRLTAEESAAWWNARATGGAR